MKNTRDTMDDNILNYKELIIKSVWCSHISQIINKIHQVKGTDP